MPIWRCVCAECLPHKALAQFAVILAGAWPQQIPATMVSGPTERTFLDLCRSPEEAVVHAVMEARRAAPAILHLPHLQLWWDTAPPSLRAALWMLLADLPGDLPLLLMASADVPLDQLDKVPFCSCSMRASVGDCLTSQRPACLCPCQATYTFQNAFLLWYA